MPTSLIPVKYIFVIPVKGIVCAVHIDTLWCQSAQAYPNSGHKKTEIDTLKHKALQHRSANLVLSSGHRGHQRPQNFLSCHLLLEEAYCAGINGQGLFKVMFTNYEIANVVEEDWADIFPHCLKRL
ncbi:hypothetical protein VYU27_002275 [Nannochloropsis oceanica]